MKITRISPITGLTHTLEVNCTPEQVAAWKSRMLIQDAMPDIEAPFREFMKSGITPREWAQTFGQSPCSPSCRVRRSARR